MRSYIRSCSDLRLSNKFKNKLNKKRQVVKWTPLFNRPKERNILGLCSLIRTQARAFNWPHLIEIYWWIAMLSNYWLIKIGWVRVSKEDPTRNLVEACQVCSCTHNVKRIIIHQLPGDYLNLANHWAFTRITWERSCKNVSKKTKNQWCLRKENTIRSLYRKACWISFSHQVVIFINNKVS